MALFIGLPILTIVSGVICHILALKRILASSLDYLEKANPDKKITNIKGFMEVLILIGYVFDQGSDIIFGITNIENSPLLSSIILAIVACSFLHGNVILAKRFL